MWRGRAGNAPGAFAAPRMLQRRRPARRAHPAIALIRSAASSWTPTRPALHVRIGAKPTVLITTIALRRRALTRLSARAFATGVGMCHVTCGPLHVLVTPRHGWLDGRPFEMLVPAVHDDELRVQCKGPLPLLVIHLAVVPGMLHRLR